MPIRPERAVLYPADWHERRLEILLRADNACEGSPIYPDCRAVNGQPHPTTGSRVVLTVAHLDHDPTHNDPDNLRAWCQRCHLAHDRDLHMQHAHETRRGRRAIGDLFEEPA